MQKERKITDNLACGTGCAAYLLERNAGEKRKVKVRQILVMDDKEIDLEQLSKEEQKQVEARLNAAALRQAGYEPSPRRKDP